MRELLALPTTGFISVLVFRVAYLVWGFIVLILGDVLL